MYRKLYKSDSNRHKGAHTVRLKRNNGQGIVQGALLKLFSLVSFFHDAKMAINMAHLGGVINRAGHFVAKVETKESGTRFKMEGPGRDDEQQAAQDLSAIRAAADGVATRPAKLQAMQLAAKHLRDEAKATARGGIKVAGAGSYFARLEYVEDSEKKAIIGPRRATERRAQADLAMLRGTALGHSSWTDGICVAAMKAKALALMEGAEKEARVAMGIDQYLYQRMAHKVEDSDPETDGDDEGDCASDDYDYSNPKVLDKLAPPPAPKQGPTQPPRDAAEATARLACFRSTQETPDALRVLLSARADPNVVAGEGDLAPLWMVMRYAHNHHVREMRDLLIEFGATNGEAELERWEDRLNIDRWEPIFMRDFHRSEALLVCHQVCRLRYPIGALYT